MEAFAIEIEERMNYEWREMELFSLNFSLIEQLKNVLKQYMLFNLFHSIAKYQVVETINTYMHDYGLTRFV